MTIAHDVATGRADLFGVEYNFVTLLAVGDILWQLRPQARRSGVYGSCHRSDCRG